MKALTKLFFFLCLCWLLFGCANPYDQCQGVNDQVAQQICLSRVQGQLNYYNDQIQRTWAPRRQTCFATGQVVNCY